MDRLTLCLLAVGCATVACASSPGPVPHTSPPATSAQASAGNADGWQLLVDFDHPPAHPVIAEHDKILDKVVGPHVHDRKECTNGGPGVIAVLQGGLQGTFTAPGVQETAYIVTTTPCSAPVDVDADKHRLVIMSADRVTADREITEHALVAVRDLDADGDNEIVVVSGKKADPAGSLSARVLDAEGGEVAEMFDFGELAWTRCAGGKASLQSATILYRKKGTSLEYKADKRQRPCP